MALIDDDMAEVILDASGDGVDAVDDPDSDLFPDAVFAVSDDPDLRPRDGQKLHDPFDPLV